MKKKAFSLVEILIVVAMLGILAAIIMPELQGYTQKAKEATAKDNLRILRNAIKIYAAQHNDVPPGYLNSNIIIGLMLPPQFHAYTNLMGNMNGTKTEEFKYGPYLQKIPENPLNHKSTFKVINDSTDFPETPDDSTGWIYKPATKEIRSNSTGTDSEGTRYYDY